jgi:hypothetical protein
VKYTVVWIPSAERELAAVWAATANRDAITRSAHRIDQLLGREAGTAGESRPEGRRVVCDLPLVVTIRVDEPGRTVRVPKAWEVRNRRRG